MGSGIHFEESLNDMLKKHKELLDQISDSTKELTHFYQETVARTQDNRLFVYFKKSLNMINEELPKRMEKGLQEWWESDVGIHDFVKRKRQGDEAAQYAKQIENKDLDLIHGWTVSTAILLKLNTGVVDISYASEVQNINQATQKYFASIHNACEDMQKEFENKYDYAEEYYNISKSFDYMSKSISTEVGFPRELLRELDVLFEDKA